MTQLTTEESRQQETDYAHEIQTLVGDVFFAQKYGGLNDSRLTAVADRLRDLSETYAAPTFDVGKSAFQVAHENLLSGIRDRIGNDEESEPLREQLDHTLLLHALTPEGLRDKSV
ncbi:MAG TPA: hypothetical protein VFM68_01050 [Candidatus Saccharimonadales bacterium]|nr:hypothetical protein [Candidatus Saccharimonadales bacterium]